MIRETHIAFHDLQHSFEVYKQRTAIIARNGEHVSYEDFKKNIVGVQHELRSRGVRKGHRILVFVPMSPELYAILEAIFSLGATAIFLDPWMKGRKMSQVIRQVKPDLFIVTKKINRIARILPATWFLKKWIVTSITPSSEEWIIERVEDSDNALITFTSGTSGIPKGANRTFEFLHAQASVLKSHMTARDNEPYIDFTNFPIVGLADFAMGNTVVIPDINLMKIHQADSAAIHAQLKKSGVNRIIVSPSLLLRITDQPGELKLKEIITGGAPISNTLIKKCASRFPDTKLEAIYGSTESEPICITTFDKVISNFDKPLNGVYVGEPVDAVRVKIIRITKDPVPAKTLNSFLLEKGQTGEVIVTGLHVNKNYFENEKAFLQNKIVDEEGTIWHRTGDLGYFKSNELFLVGRDHRVMKSGDKIFHPYPLEQFIEQKFGLTDLGYVQNSAGKFILFIGNVASADFVSIFNSVRECGYPLDEVKTQKSPLPRDARHKSKLQIEDLV